MAVRGESGWGGGETEPDRTLALLIGQRRRKRPMDPRCVPRLAGGQPPLGVDWKAGAPPPVQKRPGCRQQSISLIPSSSRQQIWILRFILPNDFQL